MGVNTAGDEPADSLRLPQIHMTEVYVADGDIVIRQPSDANERAARESFRDDDVIVLTADRARLVAAYLVKLADRIEART